MDPNIGKPMSLVPTENFFKMLTGIISVSEIKPRQGHWGGKKKHCGKARKEIPLPDLQSKVIKAIIKKKYICTPRS